MEITIGSPYKFHFRHTSGTTGLTNAVFTKKLLRDGADAGFTPSVFEVGSGWYYAFVTPIANGVHTIDVYHTPDPATRYRSEFHVLDDISTTFENSLKKMGLMGVGDELRRIQIELASLRAQK